MLCENEHKKLFSLYRYEPGPLCNPRPLILEFMTDPYQVTGPYLPSLVDTLLLYYQMFRVLTLINPGV